MNQLVKLDGVVSMSSKEIAELTGKEHFHVMRDIRGMLSELYGHTDHPNLDALNLLTGIARTKDVRFIC